MRMAACHYRGIIEYFGTGHEESPNSLGKFEKYCTGCTYTFAKNKNKTMRQFVSAIKNYLYKESLKMITNIKSIVVIQYIINTASTDTSMQKL